MVQLVASTFQIRYRNEMKMKSVFIIDNIGYCSWEKYYWKWNITSRTIISNYTSSNFSLAFYIAVKFNSVILYIITVQYEQKSQSKYSVHILQLKYWTAKHLRYMNIKIIDGKNLKNFQAWVSIQWGFVKNCLFVSH